MRHQNISVTGSLNLNGVGVATTANLNAFTASSDTKVDALIVKTGSYATTGSNTFTGAQIVQGTLTAQTLVVQTVTSSVLYTTGSNIIGSSLSNIQQITGSLYLTGSTAAFAGNVGIGTTSPGSSLDIRQSNLPRITLVKNGIISWYLGNSAQSTSNIFSIGTDSGGNTNILNVDNTGLVGIGTTTPARTLHLNSASDTRLAITDDTIGTTSSDGSYYRQSGVNAYVVNQENGTFQIGTNNSYFLTALASGNVGIGTTSPLTTLTVKSTNDNGYGLTRPSDGTTYHWRLSTTETGGDAYTVRYNTFNNDSIFSTYLAGGTGGNIIWRTGASGAGSEGERMRITSGGNIGINATGYSSTTLLVRSNSATSTNWNFISEDNATNQIFGIRNDGRIGIGTGSPSEKLSVVGTVGFTGTFTINQDTASVTTWIYGNGVNQGTAGNFKIVRHYPAVSAGSKLILPIVSQGNLNGNTIVRIWGHSAKWNSRLPLAFTADFTFGSLTVLSDLTVLNSTGNISSISTSGMNIEINFTTAYASATSSGVFVTLEYMTNTTGYSINVAGIAMN